uniref:Uncharacterized protein n=1 Tax=Arundo donax TaxID=35708 RepID=A0A0A9QL43_ARUDO
MPIAQHEMEHGVGPVATCTAKFCFREQLLTPTNILGLCTR